MRTRWICYVLASLVGLSAALLAYPPDYLLGIHQLGAAFVMDPAQEVVGQRYFIADGWYWPPLRTQLLDWPQGVNIAFTDSIPVWALFLKIVAFALPADFEGITPWIGLCMVLQPVAAVYALRSLGERRLVPAIVVAILSSCVPALLDRYDHAALSSHWLILVALGLALRSRAAPTWRLAAVAALTLLFGLLVHPYIFLMMAAVLASAPLSLLLCGERGCLKPATGLAIGCGLARASFVLGYRPSVPLGGFGVYSMNLLAPIYPSWSALFWRSGETIDATGGQYEGYQYLGAGLILLAALAVIHVIRHPGLLRRHCGMAIVAAGLVLLALSNKVYLGHLLLIDLPYYPFLDIFRVSGRLFWPVTYMILVSGVYIVCRSPTRIAAATLAGVILLQVSDVRRLFSIDDQHARVPPSWLFDEPRLKALLAAHRSLAIAPPFACAASQDFPLKMQILQTAAVHPIRANTMYVARTEVFPNCTTPETSWLPPEQGQLVVFTPPHPAALIENAKTAEYCRSLSSLIVCTRDMVSLAGLPPPPSAGQERDAIVKP